MSYQSMHYFLFGKISHKPNLFYCLYFAIFTIRKAAINHIQGPMKMLYIFPFLEKFPQYFQIWAGVQWTEWTGVD